jgi:hypothetical protein
MTNDSKEKLGKEVIAIYVVSCCFNDLLEDMKVVFDEQEAIGIWENFTGRDYGEHLENQEKDIYDYSKTAGTKINAFEFKKSEILSL